MAAIISGYMASEQVNLSFRPFKSGCKYVLFYFSAIIVSHNGKYKQ